MDIQVACKAIAAARCLELKYKGLRRVVEVHIAGQSKLGEDVMLIWQVEGGSKSSSSDADRWRVLKLDDVQGVVLTDRVSMAPREGYLKNDPVIARIVCQV